MANRIFRTYRRSGKNSSEISAEGKPWREFEKLVAAIHQNLAPGADVKHDQYVEGRTSGSRRQIDILISQKIGPYTTRIAVECRDYQRKVTIDKVEAFVQKLRDVCIHQGVMVSKSGFDAGAKAIAEKSGVTLLSYRAATDLDWKAITSAGAWARLVTRRRELVAATLNVQGRSARKEVLDNFLVIHPATSTSSPLQAVIQDILRDAPIGSRPGEHSFGFNFKDGTMLRVDNQDVPIASVGIECRIRAFEYMLNVSLGSGHVLLNAASGDTAASEFYTVPWDLEQLLSTDPDRELDANALDELAKDPTANGTFELDPKNMKAVRMVVRSQPGAPGETPGSRKVPPKARKRKAAQTR